MSTTTVLSPTETAGLDLLPALSPIPPVFPVPSPSVTHTAAGVAMLGAIGGTTAQVAAQVQASVVQIQTRQRGAGAGTIWRADGVIVTNHHVVPHDTAQVTLADGRRYDATVVARDPQNDLAVLHIPADGLPAVTLRDARTLRPGEVVLAVGHPYGIHGALTVGVVSVAGASSGRGRALIQAGVLLGPGNSGGPLVDVYGRVAGINSMVHGGLALAVPSYLAQRLVAQDGPAPRLGIVAREVALPPSLAVRAAASGLLPELAAHLSEQPVWGVLVMEVEPGGAAEAAGLLLGDILVSLNGGALDSPEALADSLAAGTPWRLGILRGGEPRQITVAPQESPALAGNAPLERRPRGGRRRRVA